MSHTFNLSSVPFSAGRSAVESYRGLHQTPQAPDDRVQQHGDAMALSRVPAPPKQIFVTRTAIRTIEEEARRIRAGGVGHETGGVLIGRRLWRSSQPGSLLIVGATGPGTDAYTTPTEFEPDLDYVNQQLDLWRARFPRLDYLGTWHKHPTGYATFSPGDVITAHATFDDPSYQIDELIAPIVLVDGGEFSIHFFYMSRAMAREGKPFLALPDERITYIPDEHPLVQAERFTAILDAGAGAPVTLAMPPWARQELRALEQAAYQVALRHDPDQPGIAYVVASPSSVPHTTIYFVVSEGGPLVNTSFYVERDGVEIVLPALPRSRAAAPEGAILLYLAEQIVAQLLRGRTSQRIPTDRLGSAEIGSRKRDERTSRRPTLRWLALASGLVTLVLLAAVGARVATRSFAVPSPTPVIASPALMMPTTTAVVIATATPLPSPTVPSLAELWEPVAAASNDLARQIQLIAGLLNKGVSKDPGGTPTAQRLHQARLAYSRQLVSEGRLADALSVASTARDAAASLSVASLAAATDQIAAVLVAMGQEALTRDQLDEAYDAFNKIQGLRPTPGPQVRPTITAFDQAITARLPFPPTATRVRRPTQTPAAPTAVATDVPAIPTPGAEASPLPTIEAQPFPSEVAPTAEPTPEPSPSPEPERGPINIQYDVLIETITEESMRQLVGDPICAGCNAFLELAAGVGLSITSVAGQTTYTTNGSILSLPEGQISGQLVALDSGILPAYAPISYNIQAGTYYRITVRQSV